MSPFDRLSAHASIVLALPCRSGFAALYLHIVHCAKVQQRERDRHRICESGRGEVTLMSEKACFLTRLHPFCAPRVRLT